MANRISAEVRKLILDDLVLIGSVTGGQYVVEFTKRVFPDVSESTTSEIARHMDRFDDWDFNFLFDTVLELTKISDDKFIYFCEQYVHPIFRRSVYDEEKEEWVDISHICIEAINKGLSDIGLELKAASQTAGRNIYKALPIVQGTQEPIKNIIFAAKYKPDIVIDDALANDIRVVNANGALIYDQGIPVEGISWDFLVEWYKLLEIDNTEKMMAHYFYDCLDSEAERLFYKGYISYIKENGKHLPALIPQVYMYYDPKTKNQRDFKIFEHQKMDFMLIIRPTQRIVIEIDGSQHYAEDEVVPGTQYKHYASPQRYAEMMKAHREMSLAGYDVYRFGGREFWVNDYNSESDIINRVKEFFELLFEKYYVK